MKTPKLIVAEGRYEVYRAGHVLIVQRDGEFYCNLRKADRGFSNPQAWVADLVRGDVEESEDAARESADRLARVAGYKAKRAARAVASPEFSW